MIERMTKEIVSSDYDPCRDIMLLGFGDSMAIYVPGRRLRDVGTQGKIEEGRLIAGLIGTFELVEGRWELARLAEKR
jgi:hypothetical protein